MGALYLVCGLLELPARWRYTTGSGSTAVAAEMLGRHYIAIELDEEYAQMARERLQTGAYLTM